MFNQVSTCMDIMSEPSQMLVIYCQSDLLYKEPQVSINHCELLLENWLWCKPGWQFLWACSQVLIFHAKNFPLCTQSFYCLLLCYIVSDQKLKWLNTDRHINTCNILSEQLKTEKGTNFHSACKWLLFCYRYIVIHIFISDCWKYHNIFTYNEYW